MKFVMMIALFATSVAGASSDLDQDLEQRSAELDYELEERWNPNSCDPTCAISKRLCMARLKSRREELGECRERWNEFYRSLKPIGENYLCKYYKTTSRNYPIGLRWPEETFELFDLTFKFMYPIPRNLLRCAKASEGNSFELDSCQSCKKDLQACRRVSARVRKDLRRCESEENDYPAVREARRNEYACGVHAFIKIFPEGEKTLKFIFRSKDDLKISNPKACLKVEKEAKKAKKKATEYLPELRKRKEEERERKRKG